MRGGCGRHRLSVESRSDYARNGTAMELMVPGDFPLLDDAVLLCFACVETLCAMELLHSRDVL